VVIEHVRQQPSPLLLSVAVLQLVRHTFQQTRAQLENALPFVDVLRRLVGPERRAGAGNPLRLASSRTPSSQSRRRSVETQSSRL
jgi:hypothetical protein